jgi:hypothetical protein
LAAMETEAEEAMTDRLAEVRELLGRATPGPWTVVHHEPYEESVIKCNGIFRALLDGRRLLRQHEDAEAIVALRNLAPDLFAAVDAAEAVIAAGCCGCQDFIALRDALARLKGGG